MKRLFYLLIITPFIYGCNDTPAVDTRQTLHRLPYASFNLQIVNIDSCEYIYGPSTNGFILTHKGNCKFCKLRNNGTN